MAQLAGEHANEYSVSAEVLKEHFQMDDMLSGEDDIETAKTLQ